MCMSMLHVHVHSFVYHVHVHFDPRLADVPTDEPSFFFFLWNFSAVGTLLVFWTEYGLGPSPPLSLQQSYLIIIQPR